jgi:hypothetical protein
MAVRDRRVPAKRKPVVPAVRDDPAPIALGDEQGGAGAQQIEELGERHGPGDVITRHADEIRAGDDRIRAGLAALNGFARDENAQESLPAHADERIRAGDVGPLGGQLPGDRDEEPAGGFATRVREGANWDRVGAILAQLQSALGPLDVDEDRAVLERNEADLGAGATQEVKLPGVGRRRIDPDDRGRLQPDPGRREGAVRHAAAETPAARVVVGEVARRRPDDDDLRSLRGRRQPDRILRLQPVSLPTGVSVFFYELHEGDEEIFSDVLVASESEMEPDEFFDLVQSIRRRIQDSYQDDTLIEAIAVELERDHGFIFVSDERLTASVNVSVEESENFLAEVGREDEDLEARDVDYRAVIAEFDPDGEARSN